MDIKVGEMYNVREKVNGFNYAKNAAIVWDCGGHPCYFRLEDFSPISPENGIKNTDTAPKYNPNRHFRKGDRVKPRERNGRSPWAMDMTLIVVTDERTAGVTVRDEETGEERLMCVLFLELVTPVEELEPYYIERHGEKTGGLCYTVHKHGGYAESSFYYGTCRTRDEAQAKAAAEAERDRLNAEYRKEQENGQNG